MKSLPILFAAIGLSLFPAGIYAWEPNLKELETSITAGQFAPYSTNLAAWLSQTVPSDPGQVSQEALQSLLHDPGFVSALDQRQILSKHGLPELGNFARGNPANQAFLKWLFQNFQAMDLYLEAAVPVGIRDRDQNTYSLSPATLDIWRRILEADPEAREGLYLRLAIATALRPPGTGNRGAGMQAKPSDPVVRYLHFKQAHKNKELFPSFDRLSVWEYQHVVSSCASEEDLAWARQMINTWRPDLRKDEQVVNSTSEVKYGNSPHPYSDYKSVLSGGGKCGPRSSWAVMICQAFGIPAIGVLQPGHACVAYKAANPASEPQPGSAWKVAYGRGWQVSKLEGLAGPEFLEGVQERERKAEFSAVEHLCWLSSALASPETAAAVKAVARKIQQSAPTSKGDLAASAKAEEAEKEPSPANSRPASTFDSKATFKLGPDVTRVAASGFSRRSGVRLHDCFSGGKQINFEKNIKDSWVEYSLDVPVPGTYALALKTATPNDNQLLNIASGTNALAAVQIPNTTGLWAVTPPTDLRLDKGTQILRISAPFQRGLAVRYLEFKLKSE